MESSEQPQPQPPTMPLPLPLPVMRAIGVVRTSYSDPEATPIQAAVSRAELGQVELFDDYHDGLDGLADFDYAWLLTWLHNPYDPNETPAMRQVPFLLRPQRRKIGVFASRGPRRVNSIGLSLIKVGRVGLSGFSFAGVDMIDGTPVLDVKPYVTQYDRPPGDAEPRCGWFDAIAFTSGSTPADFGRRPDDTGQLASARLSSKPPG